MLAALLLLAGCPAAPVQVTPQSVRISQWEINGLMSCDYTNGVLSNCALNDGATLDDLANSLLNGTAVTE